MDSPIPSVCTVPTGLTRADPPPTAAETASAARFRANLAALARLQPALAGQISEIPLELEWVFARDGSLTAREGDQWWTGCSVPLLAGREMLKKLEMISPCGCFLAPTHAGQLRAAFEKIAFSQAIVAVVADLSSLAVALHCDDFTPEIESGRLLFAAGERWPLELAELFREFSGLPLPQQFLRTALLDDAEMGRYTAEAQPVIAQETIRRTERISKLLAEAQDRPAPAGPVRVVADSNFNLSNWPGVALTRSLIRGDSSADAASFAAIDPNHPLTASPLALAEAAIDASAIVTADFFRADFPGVVASRTPWITWVTTGRILPPQPDSPRDGILLADPRWRQDARDARWPADCIAIATWPAIIPSLPRANPSGTIGLLVDTRPIDAPQRVRNFSSQLLLWEHIQEELASQPLALGEDPILYLQNRMARLQIAEAGFDRDLFLERLIHPAYQQGLARLLIRLALPLRVCGRGWNEIPEFRDYWGGELHSIEELAAVLTGCDAIINPRPDSRISPLDCLPAAVIHPAGMTPQRLLSRLREATGRPSSPAWRQIPALSRQVIMSLLAAG